MKEEKVNDPSHYDWFRKKYGIRIADILDDMDFTLGSAAKYILRAGLKSEEGYTGVEKEIEDLEKSIWYIQFKINKLKERK